MNNLLTKKREQLHSQIRTEYIQNYIKKIRYQLLQQQLKSSYQTLNNLIEQTTQQITPNQLQTLLQWTNHEDQNNAIIHLGNLLIDQIISLDYLLTNFQLKPQNSQYWLWLIKIILTLSPTWNHSLFNQQFYLKWQQQSIQYVLHKLLTSQQIFSLSQCLEILKILIDQQNQKIIKLLIVHYKGVFLKVKQSCFHFDKKVSELSYEIMDQIVQSGDQNTIDLIGICSLFEIERILILGLNKLDLNQRKFPLIICRIVNNIYASKIRMSVNILKACINSCLNPQNTLKVKVEFSYLWLSFTETCTLQSLIQALQEKLLNVFQTLLYSIQQKNHHFKTIVDNVCLSLRKISQKIQKPTQNHNQFLTINSNITFLITESQSIRKSINLNHLTNTNISLYSIENTQKQLIKSVNSYQNQNIQQINGSSMDLE